MKNKTYLFVIVLLLIITTKNYSQSSNDWFLMPDGLGLSNQLEYSYNTKDKTEIFENWLTLDYTKNIFSAGIRFEAFQPNDIVLSSFVVLMNVATL